MPDNPEADLFKTDYSRWLKLELAKQDEFSRLSQVTSTSCGEMEYALIGKGPIVLALHGGPGGFDQSLFLFEQITRSGFSLLAPSRPGYLKTPLSTGKTMEEQADAVAALLDTLKIDRVALAFGSAGGPSGYNFAIRHPDRVTALVAVDAVVSQYLLPMNVGPLTEALFLSGPGERFLDFFSHEFPRQTLQMLLKQESILRDEQISRQVDAAYSDPVQMAFALRFVRSMSEFSKRKIGVENDMLQFKTLFDLPVDKIQCPAFIIHGTHDGDVPFYHGVYAWENIKNADKLWVCEGSHFCAWIHPDSGVVQEKMMQFLLNNHKENSGSVTR
ncbi:MAG: alpha/beta hydrolase [Methanomicrobiales archaeon]